ncbi:MAG: hypothetical protein F6K56_20345 [Moorea sp. SIO3G5]|nr:hypothetical protein [Moorena sp. SIO3G5]
MTRWVERACCCGTAIWLWNGHQVVEWASGVERASCPFPFPAGCLNQGRRGGKSRRARP